jgi:nucleoside-diphosphate-sugar epimerase
MRVVIVGATGNVGTSVLEALASESAVEEVVAVARREPRSRFPRTTFVRADITRSDLAPIFRGTDAVVHLAWLIQPGRDESITRSVNVDGSRRLFQAVVAAKVPLVVYASSVGSYSPGPKDRFVDESWPTDGIESSFYARHKAAVERDLDRLERERPELRVVRMRPALIFKADAATEIRRLFAGPLFPGWLVSSQFIPIVPDTPRLRFQAVHSHDVGDAYRRALIAGVSGAFNLAAEPPIGSKELSEVLNARRVRVRAALLRAVAATTFHLRLQPTEPGWLDLALAIPLMDSSRARAELGWEPQHRSLETLQELLHGMQHGTDYPTPPLARTASGPLRIRELMTGVGARP